LSCNPVLLLLLLLVSAGTLPVGQAAVLALLPCPLSLALLHPASAQLAGCTTPLLLLLPMLLGALAHDQRCWAR
jgi:hypothetical protein